MAPGFCRSSASASLVCLPSSTSFSLKHHPNNKLFNLRSAFLPQNNGVKRGFSCAGLRWKLEKRNNRIGVRCQAAVAEEEAADTSSEKFEYQAEVGIFLFFF